MQTVVSLAQQSGRSACAAVLTSFISFLCGLCVGKLEGQAVNAAFGLPLLRVTAQANHQPLKFIVDTGAGVSLVPPSCLNGTIIHPSAVTITTASGQKLNVYGEATLDIVVPTLRRSFTWTFVVADVTEPLLGNDFLAHHSLVVDCGAQVLRDSTTLLSAPAAQTAGQSVHLVINDLSKVPEAMRPILQDHPAVLSPNQPEYTDSPIKSAHFIDTGSSPPTFASPRKLPPDKLTAAKQALDVLLKTGVIRPSRSPWASPLHMVPKSTPGEWRVTGDYRALNAVTKPDRYPLPHIQSLSTKLHNAQCFSKVDLLRAYHQVPMNPSDSEKTAVTTPFGLFEYTYMPMGLRNAGATFQRVMDSIFRDVSCVFIYLDDILVFSENEEQYVKDLRLVFGKLAEHKLRISLEKCEFLKKSLIFLGHEVTSSGITPQGQSARGSGP